MTPLTQLLDAPLAEAPLVLPAALVAPDSIQRLRWSDAGFASRPDDVPASTIWDARILDDVTIGQSVADTLDVGGVVALTVSEVALANWDRGLDDVARLCAADGRAVTVRVAARPDMAASDGGAPLAAAQLVWQGTAGGFSAVGNRAALRLTDLTERMATDLQANRYAGTGGPEGGADLAGKPKPVSFGRRFNVAPVYVGDLDLGDGALPTYQTHWRAIAGHDALRERGVEMVPVTGTAPSVGQWRDWPGVGMLQLGFTPNGQITCDVRGDSVGGYVDTTAAVLRRMLTSLGPQYVSADFDDVAWTQAEIDLPGAIGWGAGADGLTALDAARDLLAASGAFLAGSRFGRLRLAALRAPDMVNLSIEAEDVIDAALLPLPGSLAPTPQAVETLARRNWQVLSNVAGSVAASDRAALVAAGQTVRVTSGSVAARSVKQRSLVLPGLWYATGDADARAGALMEWIATGLRLVQVTTDRYLGQVDLGHVARITFPDLGVAAGLTGLVVGWEEKLAARRLTITVLG